MVITPLAWGSFQAFDGSTDLKIFNKIQCDEGLSCSKVGSKLKLDVDLSGYKQSQILNTTGLQLASSQCGSTVTSSDAFTVNLPAISSLNVGCRLTFLVMTAEALVINPDNADLITLLTDVAGDAISANAIGESVMLEATIDGSTPYWFQIGAAVGTWTDVN